MNNARRLRFWLRAPGFLLAAVLFCHTVEAQTLSYSNLVSRLTDLEYLATLPAPGDKCALWSSYDRSSYYDINTGQYINWDANNDCCGIIRTEGTNQVLAEMTGPGCIWRIWSATPGNGHVRIYLDGTNGPPVVDLPFWAYFDGQHAPFTNSAIVHTTAANGWNNYTPIPYQHSCKIVADPTWGSYYQFTYETFPSGTVVPTFNPQLSAADAAVLAKANRVLSQPGTDPAGLRSGQTTLTNVVTVNGGSTQLVAQVSGAGAITVLRVQLNLPPAPDDYDLLRTLALQIKWDGETSPSVWAPLGDFFGTAPGANVYTSLPLGHTADGWWYCYWYMPYGNGAQVELVNDGTNVQQVTFQITTAPLTRPLAQLARFHAKWHRDAFLPTDPGRAIDWTLATTTGAGRYVGTMLHIWNPGGGWWGEGDDKFFVDGEPFPSSIGTGSEDYFGYAWSSGVLFQHALHNQTHNDSNSKGHISVNRWHIADAVPFLQSFQGYIEKYFANSRPTLYAAMGYWYLNSGGRDPYLPVPLTNRLDYWTPPQVYKVPGAIEGENLTVLVKTAGTAASQDMSGFTGQWSNEAQLWWTGAQTGDTLDLALPVATAGDYKISVALTKARDYGIVQLSLDGQSLGAPIDLYNATVIPTGPMLLGTRQLTAGQHTLRVQITGANPSAVQAYMFGLDYVRLEPPLALLDALNLGNPAGDIAVVFNAPVAPASATNPANYTLNNGAGVVNARMGATPETVLLQATGLVFGGANLLTANNVQDLASPPNTISANSTLSVDQNLHSWYRLDEPSGLVAYDASGNNRNGSLLNGALPGYAGQVLRALQFDGNAGHVALPGSGYDNFTSGLTVALWANPTSTPNWARFIDFGNGAGSDNILFARNGTSSDLTFEVYLGGVSGGKVTAAGALSLNVWQHLAATMDSSGRVILYKNGAPLITNFTAVPSAVTRINNYLGRSNWSQDGYYQGKLDDVRLYNRVLSPAALRALANGGGADDGFAPALAAQLASPTSFVLSWPASAGAFLLQQSPTLAPPNWMPVTNNVVLVNGSCQVTVPATNGQLFYRLYLQ
jgi:hypothetical protein